MGGTACHIAMCFLSVNSNMNIVKVERSMAMKTIIGCENIAQNVFALIKNCLCTHLFRLFAKDSLNNSSEVFNVI